MDWNARILDMEQRLHRQQATMVEHATALRGIFMLARNDPHATDTLLASPIVTRLLLAPGMERTLTALSMGR